MWVLLMLPRFGGAFSQCLFVHSADFDAEAEQCLLWRVKRTSPICAQFPLMDLTTPWTCSSSETVANLMSPRRHHAGREPVPSSSWLFSVPWAVIVPMAVGGPFRIHSNITPINAPTTGPTI